MRRSIDRILTTHVGSLQTMSDIDGHARLPMNAFAPLYRKLFSDKRPQALISSTRKS
jgi:hypothetical protein